MTLVSAAIAVLFLLLHFVSPLSIRRGAHRSDAPKLVPEKGMISRSPVMRKKSNAKKTTGNGRDRRKSKNFALPIPDIRTQLEYARNGHAVLRALLPAPLIHQLYQRLRGYAQSNILQAYQQKVAVTYNDNQLAESLKTVEACRSQLKRKGIITLPFLQYFNSWRSISQILDIATLLAPVAAELMDCATIRLYQDSLFYKTASDSAHGPTPWHVDARMAPFDTSYMITFWIPLHDITESGLVFCSKSHSDFALPFWTPYPGVDNKEKNRSGEKNVDDPWQQLEARYKHAFVDYMPLREGDVTVHSGWTLHCADGCTKSSERWALAITFVDGQAQVRCRGDGDKGDNEDMWSYREWLEEVRKRQAGRSTHQLWHHPQVPVLWPPSKQTKFK